MPLAQKEPTLELKEKGKGWEVICSGGSMGRKQCFCFLFAPARIKEGLTGPVGRVKEKGHDSPGWFESALGGMWMGPLKMVV